MNELVSYWMTGGRYRWFGDWETGHRYKCWRCSKWYRMKWMNRYHAFHHYVQVYINNVGVNFFYSSYGCLLICKSRTTKKSLLQSLQGLIFHTVVYFMSGVPEEIYCYSLEKSFSSEWAKTFFLYVYDP